MTKIDIAKMYCHACRKSTNHKVIAAEQTGSLPEDEYSWERIHYFARCAGCDSYTFAIESSTEDDWNPATGEMESTWKTYPRGATERPHMSDVDELPPRVQLVYIEVIGAMNSKLPVLAGIGLRALIEAVCRDRKIAGGNLVALIDGLATSGILSTAQAAILHGHRFLGNAAAHQVTSAPPRELVAALDIAENVLRTIYVLPKLSRQVKTGRKPKGRRSGTG